MRPWRSSTKEQLSAPSRLAISQGCLCVRGASGRLASWRGDDDAIRLLAGLRPEAGADVDESVADPAGVLAVGEARVAVLELERDGLQSRRSVGVEINEEEEPQVVAQLGIDDVVVDEVA